MIDPSLIDQRGMYFVSFGVMYAAEYIYSIAKVLILASNADK